MTTTTARRAVAQRPFGYGIHTALEPGQVFDLENLANDQKLIDLGYMQALPEGAKTLPCPTCPAQFVDASRLDVHRFKNHGEVSEARRQQVEAAQREENERQARMQATRERDNPTVTYVGGAR